MSIESHRRVTESRTRKRTEKGKRSGKTTAPPGFKGELVAKIPHLRAFARMLAMNVDRADELVRATILKAWAGRRGRASGSSLTVWLFAILRNESEAVARGRGREAPDTGEGGAVEAAGPGAQPGGKRRLDERAFGNALAQLPKQQREALVLIGASGFSYEEAGEICRCPAETVRSRVIRARRRLHEMLARKASAARGMSGSDGTPRITGSSC